MSLQPQRSVKEGESREDKVLNLAADVLKRVPELVDYEATYKLVSDDMGPLNVVLLQEVGVAGGGCGRRWVWQEVGVAGVGVAGVVCL